MRLLRCSELYNLVSVEFLVTQGISKTDLDLGLRQVSMTENGECLSIMKYLIRQGADVHTAQEYLLRCRARKGDDAMVRYLVEQ